MFNCLVMFGLFDCLQFVFQLGLISFSLVLGMCSFVFGFFFFDKFQIVFKLGCF